MLKNYMTIACRHLLRQKGFSAINILGLAVGVACCTLIFLYVKQELSHDRFHEHRENLYRLVMEESVTGEDKNLNTLFPMALAKAIEVQMPGVVRATGFVRSGEQIAVSGDVFGERFGLVGDSFLDMFTYPLLVGDVESALQDPMNVVISRSLALKLFGVQGNQLEQAIGKSVRIHRKDLEFVVSAVMEDVPKASSQQFDLLISLDHAYDPLRRSGQFSISMNMLGQTAIYLQLAEGEAAADVAAALPAVAEHHLLSIFRRFAGDDADASKLGEYRFELQPLTEVYLNRDISTGNYVTAGHAKHAFILTAIAFLVMAVACINFVTLSLGRSTGRATEVGIRKVIGARQHQLVHQFWGETLLLCLIAICLGAGLAELLLPVFNEFTSRELEMEILAGWETSAFLLAMLFATALAAGSYPAIVLARLRPVAVLKARAGLSGGKILIKSLLLMQYGFAVGFIVCTAVMVQQWMFMNSKDLGFDKEHVVVLKAPWEMGGRLKDAVSGLPTVISATVTDRSFTSGQSTQGFERDDGQNQRVRVIGVDETYLRTLGMELVSGRNFETSMTTDKAEAVIINETLALEAGWAEPLGKRLNDLYGEDDPSPQVVGVVRDFHLDGLQRQIEPLVLSMVISHGGPYVLARVHAHDLSASIAALRETWEAAVQDEPFKYSFLDQNLEAQYRQEERWMRITGYSALFVILISCLGLVGHASIAVARRTKEIGIRKVLGASVANLVQLLSRDSLSLVLAANLLGWPASYYFMSHWLENFAYRVDLDVATFAAGAMVTLVIGVATVSLQTMRVARADPVTTLRYE